ncbi:MAG: amidohydrolase family protein [Alphaproteobacteria bacterium]|nr:amidohydrolase family protein [Alphaproteobacteria bacterium]
MSYASSHASGRLIHDADSHLMELPDALDPWLDPKDRTAYDALPKLAKRAEPYVGAARAKQSDAGFREAAEPNIMLRKNYEAMGAFLKDDRPRALDALGFASQLVFTTWCLNNFGLESAEQAPLAYATATAHNRMMQDFTSIDRRFLGTAYVPLIDIDRAIATARAAIAAGAKALLIPSRPTGRSASHIGYDPVWAMAQEAGLPILFHVGDERKLDSQYFDNGLPRVKDFHGGEENFTSVSYMAIPHSVELTLAAMIIDGVLDRFPKLKIGVIELGASWLPGWMRNLDGAAMAFSRNEERLQKLSMKPSDFVKRQVRVTPYPHEDVGWLIANAGEEIFLFSSDYPHVEGGRNPLKRFDDSLANSSPRAVERFYCDNFIDLMGEGLAPDLRRPRVTAAA